MIQKIKSSAKNILALKAKAEQKKSITHYIENGKIPWSKGYLAYRDNYIAGSIANEQLLSSIRSSGELTSSYGEGLDERSVEYPWVIANLSEKKSRFLDAGSTFNFSFLIENPKIREKELCIYTFYPESNNYQDKKISYHFGDLRDLPFRDEWFDEIACVSTIEHVDMDNSMYGYDLAQNEVGGKSYDYLKVIAELERVLKPKGQLLLTFPFGQYEYHDFFQQFDYDMVMKMEQCLSSKGTIEKSFYKYKENQWSKSAEKNCATEKSYNPHTGKGKGTDGAAHSRAICCIKFRKH